MRPLKAQQQKKSSKKALDKFCINLNKKSLDGKIDPLIGRKLEVEEDNTNSL